MALVGAVEVGASITSLPTNGTIHCTCFLNLGSQGSSRQTGSDVQKASDEHQGGWELVPENILQEPVRMC